jgi:hypothetical protein
MRDNMPITKKYKWRIISINFRFPDPDGLFHPIFGIGESTSFIKFTIYPPLAPLSGGGTIFRFPDPDEYFVQYSELGKALFLIRDAEFTKQEGRTAVRPSCFECVRNSGDTIPN